MPRPQKSETTANNGLDIRTHTMPGPQKSETTANNGLDIRLQALQPQTVETEQPPAASWAELQSWLRGELEQHRAENEALLKLALERPSLGRGRFNTLTTCTGTKVVEPPSAPEPPVQSCDSAESKRVKRSSTSKSISRKMFNLITLGKTERSGEGTLKAFFTGPVFDWMMAFIVMLNVIFMIVYAQWAGGLADQSLGLVGADEPSRHLSYAFPSIETVFFISYVLDLGLRIFFQRGDWLLDEDGSVRYMNVFDAILVLLNGLEILVPVFLKIDPESRNASVINSLRVTRLSRALRIIRTVRVFRQLKILLATCAASIGALCWSLVLLLMLKFVAAIMLCSSLQAYMINDDNDYDLRLWLNRHYGDFSKALYTMFEITYSGGWPSFVRPVIEGVSRWYTLPFLVYITIVVFAVIRIITALFLKETLACAANDAELALDEKRQQADSYRLRLEEVFHTADSDGDGFISREEFDVLLTNPNVLRYMSILDLNVKDVSPLFDILDDGDHQVTIHEFCEGIAHLKGSARSVDLVVLRHELINLSKDCAEIKQVMDTMTCALGMKRDPS
eukprot:TRINITY_DN15787_c0_g2_i1.p1 TRINITY_DN15787_c0_g2~~TRINITY_DN15787_c0_g2_i1.p1  ORF type:complete len:564 (-),score=97.72 TRINITY_DN15787_c0_g2_i1:58-1749(-)